MSTQNDLSSSIMHPPQTLFNIHFNFEEEMSKLSQMKSNHQAFHSDWFVNPNMNDMEEISRWADTVAFDDETDPNYHNSYSSPNEDDFDQNMPVFYDEDQMFVSI